MASLTVCMNAAAHEAPNVVDAILLNTQDSSTRQAIRVFVREQSGPSLIADLESLAKSPVLVNHKRERRGSSITRRDFKPFGDYRLVMDGNNQCWLVHTVKDVVTQLMLPESTSCMAYHAP